MKKGESSQEAMEYLLKGISLRNNPLESQKFRNNYRKTSHKQIYKN